ncbi:olfactory receptor 5P66-like [Leptodactylus fuscus]
MDGVNSTAVTEFLILGFPSLKDYKLPFLSVILMMYSMTIGENLLIISLVSTSQRLQSPMYFFLGHLALSDIFLVTKCFLLTAMSYDRYLAICKPLHYTSMINAKLRYSLVISSWVLSFMLVLITFSLVCDLDFCGPNIINHFFCDFAPLLELSCSDTTGVGIEMIVLSFPIILLPFLCVIISYVSIFITIFGISSTSGRQKTFSTCSSHLVVVSIYYGSMLIIYMVPYRGHSLPINKFISLLYIVLTPLLNPVIYSLRNKEIQASVVIYLMPKPLNKSTTSRAKKLRLAEEAPILVNFPPKLKLITKNSSLDKNTFPSFVFKVFVTFVPSFSSQCVLVEYLTVANFTNL